MWNLESSDDQALEDAGTAVVNRSDDLLVSPIFLVGAERSGTTLTRLMLDFHPMVAFFFEFTYTVEMMPGFDGWLDLREYYNYLRANRIFKAARLDISEELDFPHLVDSFLRQKQDRDDKPLVGATVHRHFDRLLRIWPEAKFIHLVRDGRDVGRSRIEMGWAGNMYTAVGAWIEAELHWSKLRRELPADRWTEIQYETLVTEPEMTLTQVCQFLGIPYDPAMLTYPDHTTYSSPSPQAIGQWKHKLSTTEIRLAEARIGDMLTERGYACAMFRRRRYGTALFLADLFARRFAPQSWQRRLQRPIDAIENRYLK